MQRLQPNFTNDGIRIFMAQQKQRKQPITTDGVRNFMAQQKQREQLHLTDEKNIFTYCFQSIQRLQLNSKTYAIRNFMHTKHNVDNPKLRIFIPQRRRIQPNFINHT